MAKLFGTDSSNGTGSLTPRREITNPLEGAALSVGDEIASLFGFEDAVGGRQLDQWQKQNPGLHLGSQLLGLVIPYGGWEFAASKISLKGGSSLRALAQAKTARLGKQASIVSNPFAAGIIETTMVFAPFEAARGITMLSAGKSLGETATDVGFSLGAGAVLGGAGRSIQAFGRRQKLLSGDHWLVKEMGFSPAEWQIAPMQMRWNKLASVMQTKAVGWTPESKELTEAVALRTRLKRAIMQETVDPISSQKTRAIQEYAVWKVPSVGHFTKEGAPVNIGPKLNELFTIKTGTKTDKSTGVPGISRVRKPGMDSTGWADFVKSWDDFVPRKLDDAVMGNIQYPRIASIPEKSTKKTTRWFNENMTQIGNRYWMGREGSDGMFIMAKMNDKGSTLAVWKTDNPLLWNPKGEAATLQLADLYAGSRSDLSKMFKPFQFDRKLGASSLTGAVHAEFKAGMNSALVVMAKESNAVTRDRLARALGGDVGGAMGRFVRDTLAPGSFKYADEGAHIIRSSLHAGHRVASARVAKLVLGEVRSDLKATDLLKNLYKARKPTKLLQAVKKIKPGSADEKELLKLLNGDSPITAAKEIGTSQAVLDVLLEMDSNVTEVVRWLTDTQATLGVRQMATLKEHLGLARRWDDWVVQIWDDSGKKVWALSAPNKKEVESAAEAFLADPEVKKLGYTIGDAWEWRSGVTKSLNDVLATPQDMDNLTKEMLLAGSFDGSAPAQLTKILHRLRNADLLGKRAGVKGYRELTSVADALEGHMQGLMRVAQHENQLSHLSTYAGDLQSLAARNPHEYGKLLDETGALQSGIQLGHKIEQAASEALSPLLGRRSAEKLAAALNSTMYIGTLGVANLAFATLNVLSPIIQTIPHIAYLRGAPDSRIAHFYQTLPAVSRDNRLLGQFNFLSSTKIAFAGTKRLHRPDSVMREQLARAVDDNLLDQGMLDAAVGQDSILGAYAKPWQNGDAGEIAGAIRNSLTFLADRSERMSRIQALAIGTEVGQKLFRLEGDKLWQFTRQFVDNTMFSYRMVDRAAAFQGPFGSMLGLFKTWMTNYIAWTAEYAGNMGRGGGAALLQANLMAGSIGGIGGTPVGQIADVFSRFTTDKLLSEHLYGTFSEDTADAMLFGLPTFLGVSLQGSTALPGANIARDIEMLFSIASWDMAKGISKSIGEGFESWMLFGEAPWESANWRNQLIRATQFKSLYRFMAATQDQAIRSMNTGYPSLREPTIGDKVAYMAGFNPVALQREYEAYSVAERVADRNKTVRRKLALEYIAGLSDAEEMRKFYSHMQAYPNFTFESIMRTVRGLQKQDTLTPTERSIKDKEALLRASVIPTEAGGF